MNPQKCDHCDKPAVVHEVTVKNGVKSEVHLCHEHALEAGVAMPTHQPINQLLTQFVISQSGKGKSKQDEVEKKDLSQLRHDLRQVPPERNARLLRLLHGV
jgi:protein-arginine kinase activator protein McsA